MIVKNSITFLSNQSFLLEFFKDLNKFNNLKTKKEKNKNEIKNKVCDTASELYNGLLETYFDECEKKKKWIANIILKCCFLNHMIIMRGLKM